MAALAGGAALMAPTALEASSFTIGTRSSAINNGKRGGLGGGMRGVAARRPVRRVAVRAADAVDAKKAAPVPSDKNKVPPRKAPNPEPQTLRPGSHE